MNYFKKFTMLEEHETYTSDSIQPTSVLNKLISDGLNKFVEIRNKIQNMTQEEQIDLSDQDTWTERQILNYTKQQAIGFAEWIRVNEFFIWQLSQTGMTTEQLYSKYLESIK